jgi:putative membrane protein
MASMLSLTAAERDRVTTAVVEAERGTDGEIVTIITDRSDAYHDTGLHYAVLAMLLAVALAAIWPQLIEGPIAMVHGGWASEPDLHLSFLALMILLAIVFLVVRYALAWMPLRFALTPKGTKARRVRRRAIRYFKVGAEQRTVQRVGILLYLSTGERMAEIVADAAIHAKVPPETWGDAMAALVAEVRAGRPAEGMAAAVARIGIVLGEHFPKTPGDINELPDRLIEL